MFDRWLTDKASADKDKADSTDAATKDAATSNGVSGDDSGEQPVHFESVWKRKELEEQLGEERWFSFDNRRLYCLQQFCVDRVVEMRKRVQNATKEARQATVALEQAMTSYNAKVVAASSAAENATPGEGAGASTTSVPLAVPPAPPAQHSYIMSGKKGPGGVPVMKGGTSVPTSSSSPPVGGGKGRAGGVSAEQADSASTSASTVVDLTLPLPLPSAVSSAISSAAANLKLLAEARKQAHEVLQAELALMKPIYILCREKQRISKEIRKFRTENDGDAVRIGHHTDACREIWDWRVGRVCEYEQWDRLLRPTPDLPRSPSIEGANRFLDDLKVVDFQETDAPKIFSKSLKDTGFAVLTNHPVDVDLIEEVYQEWRDFLSWLHEEKDRVVEAGGGGAGAATDNESIASTAGDNTPTTAPPGRDSLDHGGGTSCAAPGKHYGKMFAAPCAATKELMKDEKLPYLRDMRTQDGYFPVKLAESAKGQTVRDIKHYYQCYFPWGRYPKEVSNRAKKLFEQMIALGRVLLEWIDEHMDPKVREHLSSKGIGKLTDELSVEQTMLRILHYPAYESNDFEPGAVRAAAHEDINLITVLPAGSARGLQVQSNQSGEWYEVPCVKGSIVINIGDMLQEMTNREYIATTHRVLKLEEGERMSTPCFVHAKPKTYISDKYPTAHDFLMQRLRELGVL
eukprot:g1484.t1